MRVILVFPTLLATAVTLLGSAAALAVEDAVQVPEPGSLVLLSVGAAAVAWSLRKRR
jgi:hypothetical protein